MPVTFQVVGNLADFGNDARAGVKVRATATPGVKVGDVAVHSNQPETVVTDAAGAFTLELVSLPGVWYRIQTPYANGINTVNLAGYVPDVGDPTTGTAFPALTVINLKDVVSEDPTPGYEAITVGATSVNGKVGAVVLDAADVGADPAGTAASLVGALTIPDSPDDIGAATAAQGAKADTAVQPADLTAYATTAGLYFPTPNAWIKWRGRRAAVMAATTQGHVAVVGDSIAFGAEASGTTAPKYTTSWPGRLRALLAAEYGPAGTGIVLADPVIRANPTYDNRWTYAGTITDLTFGFHAGANFRVDAVAGTYLEFTATADEFTVFNANAAGGVVNATIDGGAVVKLRNVFTGGAAVNIEKQAGYKQIVTKVPAGAVGTHTLRLAPDTSNATFDLFIHAIEARVNTPGTFRVSNASINGKSLSTLFAGSGKNDEVNALYGLPMVDMLRADLLIIALGSNDWLSSTPAATAKTWLKTLIQRQRAAGNNGNGSTYANGDALLVWNPQPDLTTLGLGTPSTWQAYRDMFYEVADEENVPLLDLGTRWDTYATGNAAGFFGDGIHPNDAGSLDIAPAVRRAMFAEA